MKVDKMKFKGHETFSLREGWMYKCLNELKQKDGNTLFSGINSINKLGVGNNMTKSIRYWMKSFNFIIDVPQKGTQLTELGELVYKYDKYCEDIFTSFVMHINLASNYSNATAWYLFFNKFNAKEFANDQLVSFIDNYVSSINGKVSSKSIHDDVNMIIKMYLDNGDEGATPEDNSICPLSQLQLLKYNGTKYIKNKPELDNIDEMIVLYIISLLNKDGKSISIDRLEEDELGLKKLLNLTRADINYYLDILENEKYIQVIRTAGLNTVNILYEDIKNPNNVIEMYYKK